MGALYLFPGVETSGVVSEVVASAIPPSPGVDSLRMGTLFGAQRQIENSATLNINPLGISSTKAIPSDMMTKLYHALSRVARTRDAYSSLPSVADGRERINGFAIGTEHQGYLTLAELATPVGKTRHAAYVSLPLRLQDTQTGKERVVLVHTELAAVRVDPYTGVASFEPTNIPSATNFVFDWSPGEFELLAGELARMSEGLFPGLKNPDLDIPMHLFEGAPTNNQANA